MSNVVSSFLVEYKKDIILFLLSDQKNVTFESKCAHSRTSVNMHWKTTAIQWTPLKYSFHIHNDPIVLVLDIL